MVSKFDVFVIVVAVAGGAFLIEQHHRVVLDSPAAAEFIALASSAACPDNDNVPYSASCIMFLEGRFGPGLSTRANAAERAPDLPLSK